MTHLTDALLRRWVDAGDAADRDTVLEHIAACDACGARLADLVRTLPAEAEPAHLEADDFRPRGYEALGRPADRRGWIGLAAAAALALAVGAAYFRAPAMPPPVTRGEAANVTLRHPVGETVDVNALVFEWDASGARGPFRVRVFDLAAPDTPVMTRDDAAPGFAPDRAERQRLTAGVRYRWFVEYTTDSGGTATSSAATFSIK
jgi:hypothetical protein